MNSEDWEEISRRHQEASSELEKLLKQKIEELREEFRQKRERLAQQTLEKWKAAVAKRLEDTGAALEKKEDTNITIGYELAEEGARLYCPTSETNHNTEVVKAACIEALLQLACTDISDKGGFLEAKGDIDANELDSILAAIFLREEFFSQINCLYDQLIDVAPEIEEEPTMKRTSTKVVTSDEIYATIKIPEKEPKGYWCLHRAAAYLARLAPDEFVQERPVNTIMQIHGLQKTVLRFWQHIQYLIPRPDKKGHYMAVIEDIQDFRERQMIFGANREYEFFDSPVVGNIDDAIKEYMETYDYSQEMGEKAAKATATRLKKLLTQYGIKIDWLDEKEYPDKLIFTENSLEKARAEERRK